MDILKPITYRRWGIEHDLSSGVFLPLTPTSPFDLHDPPQSPHLEKSLGTEDDPRRKWFPPLSPVHSRRTAARRWYSSEPSLRVTARDLGHFRPSSRLLLLPHRRRHCLRSDTRSLSAPAAPVLPQTRCIPCLLGWRSFETLVGRS